MDADPIEHEARNACERGEYEQAASLLLTRYGDELLAFLIARLRSQSDGHEAFSMASEDLWLGLPGFQWRCSARTWAYTLARNAASRLARAPHRRVEHGASLERSTVLSQLVGRLRSSTATYRRTETKDRFRALRDQLEPEDQTLLILRVDRELSHGEVAQVMLGDVQADDEAAILREAARLRKRFERVKEELKRLAVEAGLLPEPT